MSVWLNCLFRLKIVKKNSTEIVYNEDLSFNQFAHINCNEKLQWCWQFVNFLETGYFSDKKTNKSLSLPTWAYKFLIVTPFLL